MVAHSFLDQPANLRYRTNLFAIGLVIRLPLVLSKLNLKCDNRRFSCSTNRHLCPTELLSLIMGLLYSPPVFALVWQCFYLSLVPTFTGASAAVASIWHQRHLAVILHTDQTFFYCINQFVKCQDWILE